MTPGQSLYDGQVARKDGHHGILPPIELHGGILGSGSAYETLFMRAEVVGPMLQGVCSANRPAESEGEGSGISLSQFRRGQDSPINSPLLRFPGFVDTAFSTRLKRYLYRKGTLAFAGSGTFAVVEEVYWYNADTGGLEPCVTKTLKAERAAKHSDGWKGLEPDALREVDALIKVAGVPGVPGYRDIIIEPSGAIHIILELVVGLSMSARIEDRDSRLVGLSWQQGRLALKQLTQVLADCHRREVVHGDVKAENMVSSMDKTRIWLVDFGTASIKDGSGWENQGGTLINLAPELIRASRSKFEEDAPPLFSLYGPPADVWALGLTAYNWLTGGCLFALGKDVNASDTAWGKDDCEIIRNRRRLADLHAEWEDVSESRPIHATFREAVQQMAGASEEYQREGIHFLRSLLYPDPAKRLTAEQALDHPFLTGAFDSVAPDSLPPEIEEPIVIDNTLTRAVRKACRKMWKKKDGEESEGSEDETDEEEESDEEEERKEGEESEEESEGELKV